MHCQGAAALAERSDCRAAAPAFRRVPARIFEHEAPLFTPSARCRFRFSIFARFRRTFPFANLLGLTFKKHRRNSLSPSSAGNDRPRCR